MVEEGEAKTKTLQRKKGKGGPGAGALAGGFGSFTFPFDPFPFTCANINPTDLFGITQVNSFGPPPGVKPHHKKPDQPQPPGQLYYNKFDCFFD